MPEAAISAGLAAAGDVLSAIAIGGGGQELVGFPQLAQSSLTRAQGEIAQELQRARGVRGAPINIPTLPGQEGIAGPAQIAGLPSGTVGLFPQTEAVATTPLSFNVPSPGVGGGGNGNGNGDPIVGDPEGPGGTETRREDQTQSERESERELTGGEDEEDDTQAGRGRNTVENRAEGFVFASEQERQEALGQIAAITRQLLNFRSRVGRA